jgi:C-terminal processing protease CtpA/Prc
LGFSIVGGKESVYGDIPIYIKQVFNEGAAGQDGRLKKGDQVLSVNGISFENVTHKFAAETLKCLQGDVKLKVISTD